MDLRNWKISRINEGKPLIWEKATWKRSTNDKNEAGMQDGCKLK